MPNMTFSDPNGKQITINSPDGSTPSEQELDQLFSQSGQSTPSTSSQTQNVTVDPSLNLGQGDTSQPSQVNPNSTGNVPTDIAGDIARGFINSGAGTIDKINGVAKLLQGVTGYDVGTEGLTNVSNKLKQLASQQPQSNNSIVSGIGQFAGGVPDALAEFAGTGGGIGFIARSAALQAAQEYNKSQTPTSLIKGAAVGGTVGALLDRAPNVIEGASNLIKKWGQTSGKEYIQSVTGASDKDAAEIIDRLQNDPTFDVNPKSKIQDYDEAKENSSAEINTLKNNNNEFVNQQKDQFTKEYESAKSKSDDAVNNLIENNRDTIEDLRINQSNLRDDLAASTSANMMASTDSSTQRLADAATSATVNTVKAKDALENTFVSTFDTAAKKIQAMVKGNIDGVANENAFLEKNDLDFAPTSLVKDRIDTALGSGMGKYFQKIGVQSENKLDSLGIEKLLDRQVASGVKVRDLPPEGQAQYIEQAKKQGQTNLGKIARSGNNAESLTAASGIKNNSVISAIKLLNDTKKGLVDEFSQTGRTSLTAMNAQSDAIEGAINKGFFGAGVPEKLAAVLARVKSAINPTKMYEENPSIVPHLEGLAKANRAYSSQIDGMRNALNLYKDNPDGAVNPQKVFRALEKNDSAYLAKLRQADESLPKEDRIFDKVQKAYKDYKKVESSEKYSLTQVQAQVAKQRGELSQKFNNMRKKLNSEQREDLLSKIKETRTNKRNFSMQEKNNLMDLHSRQRQALDTMQAQKDKELSILQESLDKRLHSLHLLQTARGQRASASGTAKIFQNVGNYRSIDGMTSMNPLKMVQGSVISKFASPIGAANNVKWALHAPENLKGLKNIASNDVLKKLVATKLSGR